MPDAPSELPPEQLALIIIVFVGILAFIVFMIWNDTELKARRARKRLERQKRS